MVRRLYVWIVLLVIDNLSLHWLCCDLHLRLCEHDACQICCNPIKA